ncbi:MAG: Gfo/Idh/MocA family oxidoreductase [Candidatus Liptonbacteria bacterium]|nr:Gfo/Idh/MocA family oxidoreductase [Candidatus Liptonbacteria bacterium]
MQKPIKIGFIGCGGHSGRHAYIINKMPRDFEIVGALDINQKVAEKFLRQHNAIALAAKNPQDFFAIKGMDAVLIGTPHKYHLKFCRDALNARKHILCEKPLWEGPQQREGKRIITEAAQRNLIFSSCHLRRFEKEYVYVREHLAGYIKKFGKAIEVHFQFFYHEPSTRWKMDDSLLLDHMNHEIDLVHFLFGHSPATFWRLSHSFDEYRVAGKTQSGLGIWFSGYRRLHSHVFRNELELIFEKGRARIEIVLNSKSGIVNSTLTTQSFENNRGTVKKFSPHSYNDALFGVMKNFAAAIRDKRPSYLAPQDLLLNTTICNDLVVKEFGTI